MVIIETLQLSFKGSLWLFQNNYRPFLTQTICASRKFWEKNWSNGVIENLFFGKAAICWKFGKKQVFWSTFEQCNHQLQLSGNMKDDIWYWGFTRKKSDETYHPARPKKSEKSRRLADTKSDKSGPLIIEYLPIFSTESESTRGPIIWYHWNLIL